MRARRAARSRATLAAASAPRATRSRATLAAATALAVLAMCAPALAGVGVVPDIAGKPSTLNVDVRPPSTTMQAQIQSADLLIARGFHADPRAVAGRCSPAQAQSFSCPSSSRIGGGKADGRATGPLVPGGSYSFSADISLFLAPPPKAGDTAGVVVEVRDPHSGQRGTATGRLVTMHGRLYGLALRFDDLARATPQLPETAITIDRVSFTAGVTRTVKVHGHRVRRHLITNPGRCAHSWPYEIDAGYADHTTRQRGALSCRR